MKFKYLIILIAVTSLIVLYSISLLSQPSEISLAALPTYDGQHVVVKGVVTEYRTTTYGSQLLTIRDNTSSTTSATVYIEGEIAVEYGDRIQAQGQVQQYNGQWEIMVSNPALVTIIQQWKNCSFPLWQLAEHPGNYVDTNVNVTGIITQAAASSLELTDAEGRYCVLVVYDSSVPHDGSVGQQVTVHARFVYDAKNLNYVLKATDGFHGIWVLER
ncbi:MAG: hypothetical protein JXA00_03990 [Candidatus Thermoplasmatota archaeon]|nr:hypothetical protein [Candidatus Thermoplasmatota archaeon]